MSRSSDITLLAGTARRARRGVDTRAENIWRYTRPERPPPLAPREHYTRRRALPQQICDCPAPNRRAGAQEETFRRSFGLSCSCWCLPAMAIFYRRGHSEAKAHCRHHVNLPQSTYHALDDEGQDDEEKRQDYICYFPRKYECRCYMALYSL